MNSKTRIAVGIVLLVAIGGILFWWLPHARHSSTSEVRVALLQYVAHPALDEARESFTHSLEKELGLHGKSLTLKYVNVQGDPNLMSNLFASITASDYDVIVTFATPISQAAKQKFGNSGTPLVYAIITDPVSAGLVDSMERPGANNTASSDQWPYKRQIELIREFMGNKNRIGCLWNPGEANSQYAMKKVRESAAELRVELVEQPLASVNDVTQAVLALHGKVDSVYIPADNTAMAAAPAIIRQAHEMGIPVFAGDPGTFKAGAVAGIGVSYKDLGTETASLVARIVLERVPAGEIPVAVSKNPELMVNQKVATKLGVGVPESVTKRRDVPSTQP
jgi:putative ABC transport system substrate-binding protein